MTGSHVPPVPPQRRIEIRVSGVVQGVGFRPFVGRTATHLDVTGHVGNDSRGVFIDAQGSEQAIDDFLKAVHTGPPMAVVTAVTVRELPLTAAVGFSIVASSTGEGTTSIPPDTAVCEDCLAELRDPHDRRFGYAFIACTNCGPRFTIATGLPYDREHTTMVDFPLCADCQREYDDPNSRRFHAQPTACPACGPQLSMSVADIVEALTSGAIIAMKGIGGYHLACDARNTESVARLRARKQRGGKPFALMIADIDDALDIIEIDPQAEAELRSPARPIVLAPSLDARLQDSVAPGNGYLGVMLPYAPLHHLLFDSGAPRVLVMTSGNLTDEPICTTAEEATRRLGALADVLVHHDRRIHVACDDSVMRASASTVHPVRRSRGYAPLPIGLPVPAAHLVAVGGELKTTACVSREQTAWLSQHVGDTENLETLAMLERTVRTLCELQRVEPEAVVSDMHPAYLSRGWAASHASDIGADHLLVQHHHAHAASLLAEHRWPAGQPAAVFAFDGTGYGLDGTIWGGEILIGDYAHVERAGHLASIPLPGGDAAVRRPLRTALAHLLAARQPLDDDLPPVARAHAREVAIVSRMIETGTGCTPTTSMGRLFDAVAALLGLREEVEYEGQAAIELEALARLAPAVQGWPVSVADGPEGIVLDPAALIAAAIADLRSGRPREESARAFHEGIAQAVVRAALLVRERTGIATVGLTGGVFSNTILTGACQGRLGAAGFTVLTHRLVPPNDAGLALGQVAVAAAGGAVLARRV